MIRSKVDWSSLLFALTFGINIIIGFFDPIKLTFPKEIGVILFILSWLLFIYVLFYLRTGFFGDTKPKLDILITKGPYRFCRHPLYLSFILMILSIGLMLRSILSLVFTVLLSIPTMVYRANIEDKLLKDKFGEEWENYAKNIGILGPKLRR
ncbi:MAG: methyltransferase family protein [Candidatus Heimdallarchaeota archaeon]